MNQKINGVRSGNDAPPGTPPVAAWPSDWLRAALVPCVLAMLARNSNYGYAMSSELTAAGLGEIKGGTLYPLLRRLEKQGLVTTTWRHEGSGPGRKYFTLTAKGRRAHATQSEQWRAFARLTAVYLVEEKT